MNEWTLVGHRSELSERGSFVSLPVGIAVYQTGSEIVAWDGLCPHRGSRLFKEPIGKQELVCPYHGWTEDRIVAGAARLLTAFVGDFLFVGTGAVSLEAQLGALKDLLETLSERIASRHDFMSFPIACDWRYAVENALEDVHVPHVHPESIGKLGLECVGMERYGRNSIAYYKVTDERTIESLQKIAPHLEQCEPSAYMHALIYPYTCISSVGGLSYTITQYFPAESGTKLWSRLFLPRMRQNPPDLAFFFDSAAKFNRQVFQEDAKACERIGGPGRYLGKGEDRIRWFREASQ